MEQIEAKEVCEKETAPDFTVKVDWDGNNYTISGDISPYFLDDLYKIVRRQTVKQVPEGELTTIRIKGIPQTWTHAVAAAAMQEFQTALEEIEEAEPTDEVEKLISEKVLKVVKFVLPADMAYFIEKSQCNFGALIHGDFGEKFDDWKNTVEFQQFKAEESLEK